MHQPRQPVAEAAAQKIELDEAHERRDDQPQRRYALRGVGHACAQGGVTVLLVQVVFQRFGRVVQQVAGQGADGLIAQDFFVHFVVRPAGAPPVEEAQVPVGIAFTVAQVAAEELVGAGEAVGGKLRRGKRLADACGQFGRQALVGVQTQHPVVAGQFDGALLGFAKTAPGFFIHAHAARRAQRLRAIDAARIERDDVVAQPGDAV